MKNWSQSCASPPGRYPLAAIATYGPDSSLATKLVVSIFKRPGQHPFATHTCTTQAVDIRRDSTIADEVTRCVPAAVARSSRSVAAVDAQAFYSILTALTGETDAARPAGMMAA